jgi:hypothetical protein
MAKTVIRLTGEDATDSCGTDQLCCGLEAGIEGGIHAAQKLWHTHSQEDDFAILKADATNAFNLVDRTAMLWTTRHEWPAGAFFAFNCYKFCSLLVLHTPAADTVSLLSRAGVAQGDPLAMLLYGLATLPLIRLLQARFPQLAHIWCADDGNAIGKWDDLLLHWQVLSQEGPKCGCYPNPQKTELLTTAASQTQATGFFNQCHAIPFAVKTGIRFLGGFIGEQAQFTAWLQAKIAGWQASLDYLKPAFLHYPQTACTGLQKSLQHEWTFVQRVNACLPDPTRLQDPSPFLPLETTLATETLPALFQQEPPSRDLTALPVRFAGLSMPRPTETCITNNEVSQAVTYDVIQSLTDPDFQFTLADHRATVSSARAANVAQQDAARTMVLATQLAALTNDPDKEHLQRACDTGRFLTLFPSLNHDTNLSGGEFRDRILYRYAMQPSDLPPTCDGCDKPFSVDHAMSCPNGGLINARHDEIKCELGNPFLEASAPSRVRVEPMIYPQFRTTAPVQLTAALPPEDADQPAEPDQTRGDLLLRGLFAPHTDCIVDVAIIDLNCKTHSSVPYEQALKTKEKSKRSLYLQPCLAQRRHFSPFVAATDGTLGPSATAILKNIARRLADKWQQPYSTTMGCVHGRISIALARACHRCLRGSRISADKMSQLFISQHPVPVHPPGTYMMGPNG